MLQNIGKLGRDYTLTSTGKVQVQRNRVAVKGKLGSYSVHLA